MLGLAYNYEDTLSITSISMLFTIRRTKFTWRLSVPHEGFNVELSLRKRQVVLLAPSAFFTSKRHICLRRTGKRMEQRRQNSSIYCLEDFKSGNELMFH